MERVKVSKGTGPYLIQNGQWQRDGALVKIQIFESGFQILDLLLFLLKKNEFVQQKLPTGRHVII